MGLVTSCRKRLDAARLEISLAGEDGAVRPFDAEAADAAKEEDGDG